ncbi:MAG: amidohydrolase family protein [Lentisphaeria bacterium]|nr:amidohydrolase family protein [Lentisphaeria bacterium]
MVKNPGWVDLQVNGHNGVDFNAPGLQVDEVLRAAEELQAAGTAIFLPTLVTNPMSLFRESSAAIMKAVEKYHLEKVIPGLHLEGPFLSGKAIGSHQPQYLQTFTPENVKALYEACGGFIRLMTVSAEAEGLAEGIQAARELGIKVSVGHHMAGYAQVRAAADAGAEFLTHLGNGCPNLMGRHENPLLAGLAEERLTTFIITDGHHLPPELIKVILKVKGAAKTIVTSDSCSACGFPPGKYKWCGMDAELEPCGRFYNVERQCLIAAVATMNQCMEFLASLNILTDDELVMVGRTNPLKALEGI